MAGRRMRRFTQLAQAGALAGITLWLPTGCSPTPPQAATQSRVAAVEVRDVAHIPEQTQSDVLNFPTGERSTSAIQVEQSASHDCRAGQPFAYDVSISNLTDRTIEGVVLRATTPEGLRIEPAAEGVAAPTPGVDGWLNYNVGTLGPRQKRVFRVRGVAADSGVIRQTYDVKFEQRMGTSIAITRPVLSIVKKGPAEAELCEEIDWTYTVKNSGTGVARKVVVRDALPDGLETIDGRGVISAELGDIPAAASREVIARLKAAYRGSFASAARLTSDAGEASSASVTTQVREPQLAIAVEGPDSEYLGKPVNYLITVTNRGDSAAHNAAVSFDLPEGVVLASVTDAAGLRTGSDIGSRQPLGAIDPGRGKHLTASVQPVQGGNLQFRATASARCAKPATQLAQTHIMTLSALLLDVADVEDPVKIGDNVVYKIRVTNQGNGPDNNIRVSVTLPEGEEYVQAGGVTPATNTGQAITFAPVPFLNAKDSVAWQVTARAARAGTVEIKVTATSDSVQTPAEKTETTRLY